jgi:hypothetical protein
LSASLFRFCCASISGEALVTSRPAHVQSLATIRNKSK